MAHNATRAIPLILKHEGGYANHPNDPGGPTNKGITLATFRRYIKPTGTIADLKALTTEQAIVVYKRQYWDAVNADLLPSGVDYCVADFAVNSGPSRGAKYLQAAVGTTQDGKIGPATLAAVRRVDPVNLVNRICDDRLAFMKRIQGGRLWKTFGRGWQRRVDEVRATSVQWAGQRTAPARPTTAPTPTKPASGAQHSPTGGLGAFFAAIIAAIAAMFKKKG